jgi:hypothetical protein
LIFWAAGVQQTLDLFEGIGGDDDGNRDLHDFIIGFSIACF